MTSSNDELDSSAESFNSSVTTTPENSISCGNAIYDSNLESIFRPHLVALRLSSATDWVNYFNKFYITKMKLEIVRLDFIKHKDHHSNQTDSGVLMYLGCFSYSSSTNNFKTRHFAYDIINGKVWLITTSKITMKFVPKFDKHSELDQVNIFFVYVLNANYSIYLTDSIFSQQTMH